MDGQMEKHSSAAAFVEGGVQDACDDACSICLDAFSDSDPAAVTGCKHEFHLQCILEWCQRSSQCPMCWQAISMKDPMSQELLEAVEEERNAQEHHARTTTVFRHPLLGDIEVPVGADDAELEERIIQHLAAAAAIRRSHRHARRESRRRRAMADGHPQFLVFSTPEASSNLRQEGDNEHASAVISAPPMPAVVSTDETTAAGTSAHDNALANGAVGSDYRVSRNQYSPAMQDGAGPSDVQSFSDSLKSRLQSVSTKYKDSITKSTRGWKERWFSQNSTISNLGSDVRREVNAGIAAVSRMMERLETRDGTGPSSTSPTDIHSTSDTHSQGAAPPKVAIAVNDASSSGT